MRKARSLAGVLGVVAAMLPGVAAAEPPSGAILSAQTAAAALPAPGAAAPGNTAPIPHSDADDERQGPFIVTSLGLGSFLMAGDLQLGWTIIPQLSVFVSIGAVVVVEDDGGGASLKGVGARLWHVPFYLEARAEAATVSTGCEFDDPCGSRTEWIGAAGAGFELVHTRHFGLELRAEELFQHRDSALVVSLGVGLHF